MSSEHLQLNNGKVEYICFNKIKKLVPTIQKVCGFWEISGSLRPECSKFIDFVLATSMHLSFKRLAN